MKRIILQYMKSKKVDVAILIIATFLLSFFSVISYFTAKNICYEKKMNGIRTYGSFIYGTWTDDPQKAPKVTQDSKIRTGFCRIYEDVKISGTTITYGCPDQAFSEMTNMQLLKGHMPKKGNEIAIESFVAELTGVTKPGDTVSLLFNGKKQKFTVSGIIRNYSAFLNTCESETSSRIYPNIVFSKQKVKQKSSVTILYGFRNWNAIGYRDSQVYEEIEEAIGTDYFTDDRNHNFNNSNLFEKGFSYSGELIIFSSVFVIAVFILTLIICMTVYTSFYKTYIKNCAVFRVLGGTKFLYPGLGILQLLLITLLSIFCDMVAMGLLFILKSEIILKIIKYFGFCSIVRFLALWYICYLVVILIYLVIKTYKANHNSIRENLNHITSQISISHDIPGTNLIRKLKCPKAITILRYILFMIAVFFCLYTAQKVKMSYEDGPDYELTLNETEEWQEKNSFILRNDTEKHFSYSIVDKLQNDFPNTKYTLQLNAMNNMLLVSKDHISDYFRKWIQNHQGNDTDVEGSLLNSSWPEKANAFVPLHDVDFYAVSDTEYQEILRKNKIQPKGNDIVIFMPECQDDQKGNCEKNISFGGLFVQDGKLKFRQEKCSIDGIISGYFSENGARSDSICVVLNQKTIKKRWFINGYNDILFYLNKTDQTSTQTVSNAVSMLYSTIQGGIFYSKSATATESKTYEAYVRTVSVSLLYLIVGIMLTYAVCEVFSNIRRQQKSLGILMVLGMSRHEIVSANRMNAMLSTLISLFICDLFLGYMFGDGMELHIFLSILLITDMIVVIFMCLTDLLYAITIRKMSIRFLYSSFSC